MPDATEAYRAGGAARGARHSSSRTSVEDEFGAVELATIATYGDVVHTFVDRQRLRGRLPARATSRSEAATAPIDGVGLLALDHIVGNVELGRMDHWVEFYERCSG